MLATTALTEAERAAYSRDGQVTPDFQLPEAVLTELRAAAEALMAARSDLRPEFIPMPQIPLDESPEAIALARRFLDFAQRPEILDMIESLIGPDIVFWAAALFSKPGGDGRPVPWHQDGVYWPLEPMATVTLWVALDESRVENGCMCVIPGSHKQGFLEHRTSDKDGMVLNSEIAASAFDLEAARPIELMPGQVSLHDAFLVHGSAPNSSPKRRAGMTFRYMPATTLYERGRSMTTGSNTAAIDHANRPIWLLRGEDRAGNDFQRGHWWE